MGAYGSGGFECKGMCKRHYKDSSHYKSGNNYIWIDSIPINLVWLGFKRCKTCNFFVITKDKKCACCHFRFSMRRPTANVSYSTSFKRDRDLYLFGYKKILEMVADYCGEDYHYTVKRYNYIHKPVRIELRHPVYDEKKESNNMTRKKLHNYPLLQLRSLSHHNSKS
jgi:hypothetical protein